MDPATMVMVGKAVKDLAPSAAKTVGAFAPAIGDLAGHLSKAGKADTRLFKTDLEKQAKGQLGWTEAQKRQAMGEALMTAQQQATPMQAELARQQGAMGFGRSGVTTDAQAGLVAGQQAAGAQALGNAAALSQQQAQIKDQMIRADILRRKADAAKAGEDVAKGVAGAAGGTKEDGSDALSSQYAAYMEKKAAAKTAAAT